MPTATENSRLKYKVVYDYLTTRINKGTFKVGSRLPSERMLAEQLNVNMATVRRAFKELTISGIVDKKIGSGTYLKRPIDDQWQDKIFNIVLPKHSSPTLDKTTLLVPEVAAEHNRQYNIIFASDEELPELFQSFVLHNQPTIAFGLDSARAVKEIQKAPELFVLLGQIIEGIPSVTCDDNCGIRMLMEHLIRNGHRRIALFRGITDQPVAEMQNAVYKSCIAEHYTPDLDIGVSCENMVSEEQFMDAAYETMLKAARQIDFTALLCLSDEIMFPAVSAFHSINKRVPEDFSVVSIGNTYLSRYSCPPVSCYDPDIKQHLNQAFQLLEKNHLTPDNCENLRLIRPVLKKRKSVKNLNAK